MALVDVNVLIAAHRADHPQHERCRDLLDGPLRSGFAWCAHTRNGFLRLATHSALFQPPTPLDAALACWERWTRRPASERLPGHEAADRIFVDLCRRHRAQGNAVYDLHLAALAMATERELTSLDEGFARIAGLRWFKP
jgi:toxin-antitoxin system PIN domain toxin